MFTAITPRYDLLNRILSCGLDRFWRRRVVALSGLREGGAAVDVCCGTGDLSGLLAIASGSRGRVCGVDFCDRMLECARRKFADRGRPQLEFVQGDALRLPFANETFDAATMAFGLRNLADSQRGFEELRRVVCGGGTVVVLELTRPHGWLRAFYYPYLFVLLPLIGGLVSWHFGAYRYLAHSIAEFLPPQQVLRQMTAAGLRDVRAIPLCGGIATIFYGRV